MFSLLNLCSEYSLTSYDIPEQAAIVREIYDQFLRGASLRIIQKDLERRQIPNAVGGQKWTDSAVRGILTNEKYVGDVLMQKTFRQDCISRKTIRNTGQLPHVPRSEPP